MQQLVLALPQQLIQAALGQFQIGRQVGQGT
jgi:hypothetical protein